MEQLRRKESMRYSTVSPHLPVLDHIPFPLDVAWFRSKLKKRERERERH